MVSSSNSDVSAVALQRLLQIQYVDEVVVEVEVEVEIHL